MRSSTHTQAATAAVSLEAIGAWQHTPVTVIARVGSKRFEKVIVNELIVRSITNLCINNLFIYHYDYERLVA